MANVGLEKKLEICLHLRWIDFVERASERELEESGESNSKSKSNNKSNGSVYCRIRHI